MARSGIFNLISRDERFGDLTATEALIQRLRGVRARRKAAGEANTSPTFADIARTHILYVRESFHPHVALTSEYVKVQPSGGDRRVVLDGSVGASRALEFVLPSYGHFISDIAFNIKLPTIGTGRGSTYYRWAAYPGVRLLQEVSLRSDRVEIDRYDAEDAVFHGKFRVPDDRRPAWERMVGQEETRTATVFNRNGWTGVVPYRDGLQTPKKQHLAADLWVPAQLWMCETVASALPTSLIPTSQRIVRLDFEALERMVYAEDGCDTAVDLDLTGVTVEVEMYVNCLFTNPEVAAIYHSRVGFSLVRVHRGHTARITANTGAVRLNNLKWPLEYIMVGARDADNSSAADRWHLMGRRRTRARAQRITVPALYYNGSEDQLVAGEAAETSALDPIISTLGLQAESDVMVYPALPATFYNAYLPGRYAHETRVSSTTDPGAYLLNFCLWPGRREQTGTLDASAIRDLNLVYTAAGVSVATPSDLIIRGVAVNFLVRSGDTVHLRYGL